MKCLVSVRRISFQILGVKGLRIRDHVEMSGVGKQAERIKDVRDQVFGKRSLRMRYMIKTILIIDY